MNIEHKMTPVEHWIVDGKAYRLATEADVGKECYFDDCGFEHAMRDVLLDKLFEFRRNNDYPFAGHVAWKFAYIQDDSLLTPQRVPVPALGDGWFLLTAEDEFQAGDKRTLRDISGGWIDHQISHSNDIRWWISHGYHAARYFGVTGPAAQDAEEIKPVPAGEPAIDWTKPVRTKDGRAVRVLCTDGPGDYPVIGIIGGDDSPDQWALNGQWMIDDVDEQDLENVPPEPKRITIERWANIYDGDSELYWARNRREADANASRFRKRLACVKVIIDCIEGEGLDVQP